MANSGRNTTGSTPRLLQLGLDKIIEHFDNSYKGEGDKIFQKEKTDKGFYDVVQLAGMGMAARKGEGDAITYDSLDQDWNSRFPIFTFEKSARITMEAVEDNMYEDMLSRIGKALVKAHNENKDYQQAAILNRAVSSSYLGPDGKALVATDHPIQAGGSNSNRLSPDLDLSEDAVEAAVMLVDKFKNPDGLESNYNSKVLVVPVELKYVAERICGSKYRTSSADNDINAVMNRGDISGYISWKRLSDATNWFITTDAPDCLIQVEKKGITSRTFKDDWTFDTVVSTHTRFRSMFADYRGIVGSAT